MWFDQFPRLPKNFLVNNSLTVSAVSASEQEPCHLTLAGVVTKISLPMNFASTESFCRFGAGSGDLCEVRTRRTGAALDLKAGFAVGVVGPAQVDLAA